MDIQWLSAARQIERPDPKSARLTQEKLVFPGETGSGIVTPRGFTAGQKRDNMGALASTSGSKRSGRNGGTLDDFLLPRGSSTPSQSKRNKTMTSKGKAALSFVPASNSNKGKETVVHIVEDESQVVFLKTDTLPGGAGEMQQQRHKDATTTSDAEPDLRSDREECPLAADEPQLSSVKEKQSTAYVLPPMPVPMPQFLRSMFGFGELPPHKAQQTVVNTKKRKRAVVESSSPLKPPTVLIGPSSPAPSTRTESDSPIGVSSHILVAETEQPKHINVSTSSINGVREENAPGHGDRIAWGTQDATEYRRLNRTESERLIDEQLVVRRGPREALPATQERTDYMDRFRSESYSPAEYTATEGQMNEFRKRMGLSPLKKPPSQRTSGSVPGRPELILPMMDLDEEATQISDPPSQARVLIESFDESATQQSSCPASSPQIAREFTVLKSKADDSGFGQSSPDSERMLSSPASDTRLEDALSKARIEARTSSLSPIKPSSVRLAHPGSPALGPHVQAQEDRKQDGLLDGIASSSGEESDFDESTILSKPRERRILALATQETQGIETQFIHIQETQLVPCSQEESFELDMDLDMGLREGNTAETETMKAAAAGGRAKAASKARTGVSKQINAAWFPQLLSTATAAASSKANEQDQSILTDFFNKKPGGPAERAVAEKEARQKEFANAVFLQRRESRRMKKVDSASTLGALLEGDDDDIEVDVQEAALPAPKADEVVGEDVREVGDSDSEDFPQELASQTYVESRLPCEGWVLGQKRHKTPTPVKQYRYRHM